MVRGSRRPGPSFPLTDRREHFASFSAPLRAGKIRNPQSFTNRFSLQSLKMFHRDAAIHPLLYQQFLGWLSSHGGHELSDLSSAGSSRSIILSSTVCSGCGSMTAEPLWSRLSGNAKSRTIESCISASCWPPNQKSWCNAFYATLTVACRNYIRSSFERNRRLSDLGRGDDSVELSSRVSIEKGRRARAIVAISYVKLQSSWRIEKKGEQTERVWQRAKRKMEEEQQEKQPPRKK